MQHQKDFLINIAVGLTDSYHVAKRTLQKSWYEDITGVLWAQNSAPTRPWVYYDKFKRPNSNSSKPLSNDRNFWIQLHLLPSHHLYR